MNVLVIFFLTSHLIFQIQDSNVATDEENWMPTTMNHMFNETDDEGFPSQLTQDV